MEPERDSKEAVPSLVRASALTVSSVRPRTLNTETRVFMNVGRMCHMMLYIQGLYTLFK